MPSQGSSMRPGPGGGFALMLDQLSAILQQRHSPGFQAVFAILAVVCATAARVVLDGSLPPGFPFLTFFPAVLLTLMFASVAAGVAVAVVCGVVAWVWFIPPFGGLYLSPGSMLAVGFYALIVGAQILFVATAVHALDALRVARQQAADHAAARDLMFSELQHRVSNNLATVAALLRMQSGQTADAEARQALTQAQLRIGAISRLQRRLHAPDRQTVEAGDFLRNLAADTAEAAADGRSVDVVVQAERLDLTSDQAVPLGLIASELVMNAIEHGGDAARIRVTLTRPQGSARLEVRDNGPGLPEGFDLAQTPSLGLAIARQFAVQLGGVLVLESAPQGGTRATLTFPA